MSSKLIIIGFISLFGSLMVLVIVMAYSRQSGNTGLDMAKIHELRSSADPDIAQK
jgi:hypothetical protein